MALAQRDVDLGLVTIKEIEAIPRTRFAPVERKRVAKALIAGGASERQTAKALGVSKTTVRNDMRGRNSGSGHKVTKSGHKVTTQRETEDAAARDEYDKTAFLHRADLAVAYAVYTGKIDNEICRAARAAALAWNALAQQMEQG